MELNNTIDDAVAQGVANMVRQVCHAAQQGTVDMTLAARAAVPDLNGAFAALYNPVHWTLTNPLTGVIHYDFKESRTEPNLWRLNRGVVISEGFVRETTKRIMSSYDMPERYTKALERSQTNTFK